jgi:hypothetical protein
MNIENGGKGRALKKGQEMVVLCYYEVIVSFLTYFIIKLFNEIHILNKTKY